MVNSCLRACLVCGISYYARILILNHIAQHNRNAKGRMVHGDAFENLRVTDFNVCLQRLSKLAPSS